MTKKKVVSLILFSLLFLFGNENILANVNNLNLKLPFVGGESWDTTCTYQDTSFGCSTHAKFKSNGEKNKDEWAIDFNLPYTADCGKTVVASASGIVYIDRSIIDYGNRVDIDHGNDYKTRYAHLQSISVNNGDYVIQGQEIGKVGSTGDSSNCHLHFVLYHNNSTIEWSIKPTPMSGYDEFASSGSGYVSDNYYTTSTNFTFPQATPQGWQAGYDTETAFEPQWNELRFHVVNNPPTTNPSILSPTFPKGLLAKDVILDFQAKVLAKIC